MHCASCGTELIPGKRFCHACGTPVPLRCPNCGSEVSANFRHCPDCGYRLGEEAPGPSSPAIDEKRPQPSPVVADDRLARLSTVVPEELATRIRTRGAAIAGERKVVTVLFCDLVGSTALAERLDAEAFREVLEEYLAIAFREIYRFEGIVTHLAGDGVMALFGAPIAHENAPYRAVSAAIALRDALAEFTTIVPLQVRMGIHSGPVVVGTVGNDLKMDYTAVGDTTNLAARLQSLGAPSTIMISDVTYRRVRGYFDMQPAGRFEVKGKSEPVEVYEVLGLNEATTRLAIAAARGLTPLVGRRAELRQLFACYERLGDHLAQVVAVVGEEGSGKSRLLYEFKDALAGEPVVFLEARCSSLSQNVPYGPWASMLAQYFGVAPGEPAATAVPKLREKLDLCVKDGERVFAGMCRILRIRVEDLPDVPIEDRKRETFEAVANLVGGLVHHRGPVVLTFEDLQWIDDESREMLILAVQRMHSMPVMLIVTHRAEFDSSWRTPAAFTQLNLRALSEEEATEIIRSVAGGPLPEELEEVIRVRAEGNPFFTEEITRALIEEGYVVRDNGTVRLKVPASEIPIPGTVEEVIGARVDRFGTHAKRVIQVAAVLGRQFHRQQLVDLLAGEDIDVSAQLGELERHGLIHRKTMMSDDEYRFGESLTQEVAYESLLLKDRRQLHERVGEMLEARAADGTMEDWTLEAYHYSRSDHPDKAIRALLRAADQAAQLPSYRTALDLYREAWRMAEAALDAPTPPAPEMVPLAAQAARGLGRVSVFYGLVDESETERAMRRARALSEELGDAEGIAASLAYEGMMVLAGDRTRFAEGLDLVERGVAHARAHHLGPLTLNVSRAAASAYLSDGRFQEALSTLEDNLREIDASPRRAALNDLYLGTRYMRDNARYITDDLDGAIAGASETYELAVRGSNRTVQAGSSSNLALAYLARGQYVEAKRCADRGLEMAEAIAGMAAIRTAAAVGFLARQALGEAASAGRVVQLVEQEYGAGGDMAWKSLLVVEVLLSLGEIKRARKFAEIAYEHAGGRLKEAIAAAALGDVWQRIGQAPWPEAQGWYSHSERLAAEVGSASTLAAAQLGAVEIALQRGEPESAASAVREVVELTGANGLLALQARARRLGERLSKARPQEAVA